MKRGVSHHVGYTLAELLVTIAIIAILAAISVPSFKQVIDRAKWMADQQTASHISQLLALYFVEYPEYRSATLSAYDVRAIIKNHHQETVSFTPQTRNAGFFYDAEATPLVTVITYDDAYYHVAQTSAYVPFNLQTMHDPARLFGPLLLTQAGSPIAEIIDGISKRENADTLINILNNPRAWSTINPSIHQLFETMLDINHPYSFHQERIAFVTHSDWLIHPNITHISRIMFLPGLSHVPMYHGNITTLNQQTIIIPASVRTIASKAFKDPLFMHVSFQQQSTVPLKIETEAFYDAHLNQLDYELLKPSDIIDVSHQITGCNHTIDMTHLQLLEPLTAFNVTIKTYQANDRVLVYLFTKSGWVAKAVLQE